MLSLLYAQAFFRYRYKIGTGPPPAGGSYLFLDKKVTKPERSESMPAIKNNKKPGITERLGSVFYVIMLFLSV